MSAAARAEAETPALFGSFADAANAEAEAKQARRQLGIATATPGVELDGGRSAATPPRSASLGYASAGGWHWQIALGAEFRIHPDNPAFPEQTSRALSPSLFVEPEVFYEWNGGDDRLKLQPFARYDRDDRRRSHLDLR